MHAVNPTVSYHLVKAQQDERLAHAERMRLVSAAGGGQTHETRPATLGLRHRLAVATATVLLTLSAAAATAVATSDGTGPSAQAGGASDCSVAGYGGPVPC